MNFNFEDDFDSPYFPVSPLSRNGRLLLMMVDSQDPSDPWSPLEWNMDEIPLDIFQIIINNPDTTAYTMDQLSNIPDYTTRRMSDIPIHSSLPLPLPSVGPIIPLDDCDALIGDNSQPADEPVSNNSTMEQVDEEEVCPDVFGDCMNYILSITSLVNSSTPLPDLSPPPKMDLSPSPRGVNSIESTDSSISSDCEPNPQFFTTFRQVRYNKDGRRRKARHPFIKLEKNYIDERFWELKTHSPHLKDTNIARSIYKELYCDPEEMVRDGRILVIRSQLRMRNPHIDGFDRSHQSIYHRIHNLKRGKH